MPKKYVGQRTLVSSGGRSGCVGGGWGGSLLFRPYHKRSLPSKILIIPNSIARKYIYHKNGGKGLVR